MKGLQKVTRVQLRIAQEDDNILLGIVSAEPDYRLSLALNRKLGISLRGSEPVITEDKATPCESHSRFSDTSTSPELIYSLVSNRCGNSFLIRKLKNIDYIFAVHDPEHQADKDRLISDIKETDSVTAVFAIDLNSIKDKNIKHLIH